ncbi:ribose 5-phosphate isomerase B [Mycoplasmoides fastidiosum]|uniref:Ribose 5-phosphate isomerase B n=1 Tax=Mycoplasmoides fastidiosum TaxID=92758 RepID=A0ABU0LYI9_9BACT|nr:RpiB/LacA/LacB family sugar-phosphate isomerase [Mycoplasmoides fastidiosum]MDQ0513737.1 ribose 5-phosphate isomerase B [Mycoplasmoides fastidiosum]UUD37842.1 RpiB/LacA/LacB family sugar-phosphate isomerase [Mycoplasmoides fastidiosum]
MNQIKVKKIYLGADHAGFGQKEYMKRFLNEINCSFEDLGTDSFAAYDYPDIAEKVCLKVQNDPDSYGLIICGSGVGVTIAANKFRGIRAALVDRKDLAYYAVAHDKANVLCLSSRFTSFIENTEITQTFLTTEFEAGRHCARIEKIEKLEEKNGK